MWAYIDSKANNIHHPNIDAMKATVNHEWATMSADYVKAESACRKFRSRLEACVAAEGGVFEKD